MLLNGGRSIAKLLVPVALVLVVLLALVGCAAGGRAGDSGATEGDEQAMPRNLPRQLVEVPDSYLRPAEQQGTLVDFYYDTYESFSYSDHSQVLHKHAVVYLPAGYSSDQRYDVVYLMHGGWSDENTYLGTPDNPSMFKNVLDNAMASGDAKPMIVVCPTYNNTSGEDSGDYALALQLTDNYHNELVGDLMPAVEGTYSTYAEDTSPAGLKASRDHRAFMGFSMGSVCTWHTFQYCLDYFRYFLPSSGDLTTDGSEMAHMVHDQGYGADDFFIFAMSGTNDFARTGFKQQIENMAAVDDGTFRLVSDGTDGNLYYLEQAGGQHDSQYAEEYFYNGICWLWDDANDQPVAQDTAQAEPYSLTSTVEEVEEDPSFDGYGYLLFPVDRNVDTKMTLREASSSNVYVWYSDISPRKTVEIVNYLKTQVDSGNQVFYRIYSDEEIAADPSKANTGIFYFRGNPGARFSIVNAGGGFAYVAAMADSFPQALETSKRGYNSFALIYRPDHPYEDLGRAICYVHDHASELQVDPDGYSLWGGSAGARMAAVLGNRSELQQTTGRSDIPQASAVITQYTGYDTVSEDDAPTYANVGTRDNIASWRTMQQRLEQLNELGIPTEFHVYDGLEHGFGLGDDTPADGWIDEALAFWDAQSS
jgi:enterochelin esterase-like enzyme/acetyl esterase/lipase